MVIGRGIAAPCPRLSSLLFPSLHHLVPSRVRRCPLMLRRARTNHLERLYSEMPRLPLVVRLPVVAKLRLKASLTRPAPPHLHRFPPPLETSTSIRRRTPCLLWPLITIRTTGTWATT